MRVLQKVWSVILEAIANLPKPYDNTGAKKPVLNV